MIEWNQEKLLIIKVDPDESIIHYLSGDYSLSGNILNAKFEEHFWALLIICNNVFVQFDNVFSQCMAQ